MTNNQTIDGVPRATLEKALIDAMGSRARHSPHIAELRALLDDQPASDHKFYTAQLQARAAKVLGLNPENTSWFDVVGEMEKAVQVQPAPVAVVRMCDCNQGRMPCRCKP